jgi:phosphoribosylformimino-5-aminoimidazole carboxamide ribotide isomerase
MRLIPVLDLKGGVAVHAVRGERATYAPVRSLLSPSSDPVVLARAFRERLGVDACYVADLDAIAGHGDHGPIVQAIAVEGLAVWLDAGVGTAATARRARACGAARVIVGTETLTDPAALPDIVAALRRDVAPAPGDAVLSLDFREGWLLTGSPAVGALDPLDLARLAWDAGIRTYIALELGRVGTGGGPDTTVARRLRAALPDAEIVVGGGVRSPHDLRALARQGFDAALVATALHTGAITSVRLDS